MLDGTRVGGPGRIVAGEAGESFFAHEHERRWRQGRGHGRIDVGDGGRVGGVAVIVAGLANRRRAVGFLAARVFESGDGAFGHDQREGRVHRSTTWIGNARGKRARDQGRFVFDHHERAGGRQDGGTVGITETGEPRQSVDAAESRRRPGGEEHGHERREDERETSRQERGARRGTDQPGGRALRCSRVASLGRRTHDPKGKRQLVNTQLRRTTIFGRRQRLARTTLKCLGPCRFSSL